MKKNTNPLFGMILQGYGQTMREDVMTALSNGADPHEEDMEGHTPFNLAASHHNDIAGRLMTLHWLQQALAGKGPKGLNDASGSHGSTLAQYMAKWLHDDEFEAHIALAMEKGLKIDIPNNAGWTPLIAAAAMGRLGIVKLLTRLYNREALCLQTTHVYQALYHDVPVNYRKGLNAVEVAQERIFQDDMASEELGQALWLCMEVVAEAIAAK